MKAYIEPPKSPSQSLQRVRDALVQFAPHHVQIVPEVDNADLVVLHVNGRRDRNQAAAEYITKRGQRCAVIQYCIRSTQKPSTKEWTKLWSTASVVWSYLDLPSLLMEDGVPFEIEDFYYSPLGVNPDFVPQAQSINRPYIIGTSGLSWVTESIREAAIAAWQVNGRVFHLGPIVTEAPHVVCLEGMSDQELGKLWASCKYVSGLRRTEGFEFPAAEGLVCGARPILFNRRHYKDWYRNLAEYIPEGSRQEVIYSLKAIFKSKHRHVTRAEQLEAMKRFDWRPIISGFWRRCLEHA
jgi:hypothetical protein